MSFLPRAGAVLALAAVLAGCRIDADTALAGGVPDGYHRMPDGTLMANVDPDMETEYRDIMGNGIELPTHQRADGTVVLGPPGSGHNHPTVDLTRFPSGVVPVGVTLPRIDVTAPVVATAMSAARIQGPPVAGDLAWLDQTRRPGEVGPALIGGVAELDGEPGAFARLTELRVGDEFVVIGEDGQRLGYRVVDTAPNPVADRDRVFAMGEGVSEVRLVAWHTGPTTDDATDHVVRAHAIDLEDART